MIKKIRKFYKNNRIYCILMLISLFCIILMGTAIVVYFIGQTSSSKYGNRLKGIDQYSVESELKKVENYYKENEKVEKANVWLEGKIIKIHCNVLKDLTNEDIQNLAIESLNNLTDEQKSFYDIQFIFEREELAPYFGSKSRMNTVISWANYSFTFEETTTTSTTTKKK